MKALVCIMVLAIAMFVTGTAYAGKLYEYNCPPGVLTLDRTTKVSDIYEQDILKAGCGIVENDAKASTSMASIGGNVDTPRIYEYSCPPGVMTMDRTTKLSSFIEQDILEDGCIITAEAEDSHSSSGRNWDCRHPRTSWEEEARPCTSLEIENSEYMLKHGSGLYNFDRNGKMHKVDNYGINVNTGKNSDLPEEFSAFDETCKSLLIGKTWSHWVITDVNRWSYDDGENSVRLYFTKYVVEIESGKSYWYIGKPSKCVCYKKSNMCKLTSVFD